MLHPNQAFLAHKALLANQEFRREQQMLYMEPQQDAPLNLSRRDATNVQMTSDKKEDADHRLDWSGMQSLPIVNKVPPWCFPWVNYPLLPITEESLRHNQVYWRLLHAFIPDHRRVPENHVVPTLSTHYTGGEMQRSPHPKPEGQEATGNDSSSAHESRDNDKNRNSLQKQEKVRKLSSDKPAFKCVQCGVSYPHRFELNRHIKVSHVRPHHCEHCGKRFGHKNYLQVHIETVHLGRKSHKCEMCGKYLSTGGNLSVHVRTIHMGEKKYKCSICSRTFGQQCNMKTHMKRHFFKQE